MECCPGSPEHFRNTINNCPPSALPAKPYPALLTDVRSAFVTLHLLQPSQDHTPQNLPLFMLSRKRHVHGSFAIL